MLLQYLQCESALLTFVILSYVALWVALAALTCTFNDAIDGALFDVTIEV